MGQVQQHLPERFIPTGVGRLTYFTRVTCVTTVHPHGRGAVPHQRLRPGQDCGSSPRAWGGFRRDRRQRRRPRFIPTGVGRLEATTAPTLAMIGSSPRAWGG